MSRNHTEYHLVKRDECGYWDCLRTVRTFDQARRAFAVTGAERIDRWRCTPSKSSLQEVYPGRERVQPLRRVIHKYYRREADAKRREERIKKRKAAERVADVMERFWKSWDTWQGQEWARRGKK